MRAALFAFRCLTKSSVRRFEQALEEPARIQAQLLQELAAQVAQTEYGQHFEVSSAADFRSKLPIVHYEELEPWVERQKASQKKILTSQAPKLFEKTSGSSGPAKYIPYTKALQSSFSRMFGLWAHDLLRDGPKLGSGKLFFSISPSLSAPEMTSSGAMVGLEDDSDYLTGWMHWFLRPFLAVSPRLASIRDPERFKRELCTALVRAKKLEVISVWNPSFLLVLMDYIRENSKGLGLGAELNFQELWPRLKLISCWTNAQAEPVAKRLKAVFPNVLIQGKGLLATEAPMTIPWMRADGFVPLVDEVYFEFETEEGELLTLAEVKQGHRYRVIISQKGGLSRYRMGDVVEVTHFYKKTPCLEFVGRADAVSDLVGEKLNEDFVSTVLESVCTESASFRVLLPAREPHDHYVLLLDSISGDSGELATRLESELQAAHHYHHARQLGQLGACRVVVKSDAMAWFLEHEQARGMSLGDIKQPSLLTHPVSANFVERLQ